MNGDKFDNNKCSKQEKETGAGSKEKQEKLEKEQASNNTVNGNPNYLDNRSHRYSPGHFGTGSQGYSPYYFDNGSQPYSQNYPDNGNRGNTPPYGIVKCRYFDKGTRRWKSFTTDASGMNGMLPRGLESYTPSAYSVPRMGRRGRRSY